MDGAAGLRIAGLPLEGRHHRGEDDAWNIAALVLALAADGAWPGALTGTAIRPLAPGPPRDPAR